MAGLFQQGRRAIGAYFGSQPVEAIYFGQLRMWPMDRLEAETAYYVISGQDDGFVRTLFMRVPQAGKLTITGRPMTVKLGSILDAESGSFAISYFDASVGKVAHVYADPETFAITGGETGLIRDLVFPVDNGALSIAGQDAGLDRHLNMPAAAGALSITGVDAALSRDLIISAGTGSLSLTFPSTPMRRALKMVAPTASYSISGQAVEYMAGPKMPAEPGIFSISGQAAGLFAGIRMVAGHGSLTISGQPIEPTPSYDRRALAGDETGRRRLAGDESGYRRVN